MPLVSKEEFNSTAKDFTCCSYRYGDYQRAVEIGMKEDGVYTTRGTETKEQKEGASKFLSSYLTESVYIGGIRGGSCWGGENYYQASDNPQVFERLDSFLQKVYPDITFLNYKLLNSTLVKTITFSEPEYYGNTSDYLLFYVELEAMYDFLSKL